MIYISFFCSVMNICKNKNNNNNNAKKQNRLNFFEAKYDLVFLSFECGINIHPI